MAILDVMRGAIAEPRSDVRDTAPKIVSFEIPLDKIGEVIGPKGKRINEIIAMTGADIDIQDDGTVLIGAPGGTGADEAAKMIDEIANPRPLMVGETFAGKVVKIATFGAFVNLVPGRDGLVHISKLGRGKRLNAVEESGLKEGDLLDVEIQDIDPTGRISLRPTGAEWAIPEGMEVEEAPRVPQVVAELLGHVGQRLQQPREGPVVGIDDRIGIGHPVEVDRSGNRVHHEIGRAHV